MKRIAIYPGSFDPPTFGHIELIRKAAFIFDKLYVIIGKNDKKPNSFFSIEERELLLLDCIRDISVGPWDNQISVSSYSGAIVQFCQEVGAYHIVRSFRSVTDYEYERSIAEVNHALDPQIQTVFIHLSDSLNAISSSTVRELYNLGLMDKLHKFVPSAVEKAMMRKKDTAAKA